MIGCELLDQDFNPGRPRDFSLCHHIHIISGICSASYLMGVGASFPWDIILIILS